MQNDPLIWLPQLDIHDVVAKVGNVCTFIAGRRLNMSNTEVRHVFPGEEVIIGCIIGWHLPDPAKVFINADAREEVALQANQSLHILTQLYFDSGGILIVVLHSAGNIILPKASLFQVIVIAMPGNDSTCINKLMMPCRKDIVGAG